jgi:4'-phosphopantetheinyl transferase EntD
MSRPIYGRASVRPSKLSRIESLPAAEQAAAITLIFSAKEAFYKCQYPLVREHLDFHDLRVEAEGWNASSGAFWIHATRSIAVRTHTALPMQGRYLYHEGLVTAGMSLAPPIAAR